MMKRMTVLALLVVFLLTGVCSAAISRTDEPFFGWVVLKSEWNLDHNDRGETVVTKDGPIKIALIKKLAKPVGKKENAEYGVFVEWVSDKYSSFVPWSYIRLDQETVNLSHHTAIADLTDPQKQPVDRDGKRFYFPQTQVALWPHMVDTIKTKNSIGFRFYLSVEEKPAPSLTISIPSEVLAEWRYIIKAQYE